MSFADGAVIFIIALILFGPKKLPELARQFGRLMGEFRRASNDFRMQLEDEMRIAEREENLKNLDATTQAAPAEPQSTEPQSPSEAGALTQPIATAGEITMMPPSTGLPEPAIRKSVEDTGISIPSDDSAPAAQDGTHD